MNVCSLNKNLDDSNILHSELNVGFDILAITKSRIKKDSSSQINLQLNNYSIKHTPTELAIGGTLLYISKKLSYQLRNDLKLYDPRKIKSNFIEIICSKSTNMILGCIYKHPLLPTNDLTNHFVSPLLLKYETSGSINSLTDTLTSNFLLPFLLLRTRIFKTSTLIDNIFSNSTF